MIGEEHFVPIPEIEGRDHGVDPGSRVIHEHEILPAGAEESGHQLRRGAEPGRRGARHADRGGGELAQEKAGGLPLDLVANPLLRREHAARRRAHGPVVQIGDGGIEEPVREHGTAEAGSAGSRDWKIRKRFQEAAL